jgi:hypothetical protein
MSVILVEFGRTQRSCKRKPPDEYAVEDPEKNRLVDWPEDLSMHLEEEKTPAPVGKQVESGK